MSSTRPLRLTGESGNLTVFIAPSEETPSSAELESSGSEFSTPPTSPRAEDLPESPPSTPPALAQRTPPPPPPPPPIDSVPTPPLVRTVSPLRPALENPPTEYSNEPSPSNPQAPAQITALPPPVDLVLPLPPPPVRTLSSSLPAPTSSRADLSHESLPSTLPAPAQRAAPPLDSFPTPPLVRTVSPLLHAPTSSGAKYLHQLPPSTVLVPPPAFDSIQKLPPPVQVAAPLLSVDVSKPPPVQVPAPLAKAVSIPLQVPELSSSSPPPVQVPPPQFDKASPASNGSMFALFWNAVARVQEAHASLDDHISRWFGLDQSKYQWALNEYYESTGQEMDSGKAGNQKEHSCKVQKV